MNFFHRITAFFKFRGEKRAVEVTAAEIKEDMVYLHPEDDPEHTYRIRANSIAIMLNPEESIEDDDFYIMSNEEFKKKQENGKQKKIIQTLQNHSKRANKSNSPTKNQQTPKTAHLCRTVLPIVTNGKIRGSKRKRYWFPCIHMNTKNFLNYLKSSV